MLMNVKTIHMIVINTASTPLVSMNVAVIVASFLKRMNEHVLVSIQAKERSQITLALIFGTFPAFQC